MPQQFPTSSEAFFFLVPTLTHAAFRKQKSGSPNCEQTVVDGGTRSIRRTARRFLTASHNEMPRGPTSSGAGTDLAPSASY